MPAQRSARREPSRHITAPERPCKYCGNLYKPMGLPRHERKCKEDQEVAEGERQHLKRLEKERRAARKAARKAARADTDHTTAINHSLPQVNPPSPSAPNVYDKDLEETPQSVGGGSPMLVSPVGPGDGLRVDDIKTEYHPHSGIPPTVQHFEDYGHRQQRSESASPMKQPWLPFACRGDFEFADFALDAALNEKQTNRIIKLIHKYVSRDETFTITSHGQLKNTWERGSALAVPFTHDSITVKYQGQDRKYDVWYRPIWDWVLSLLREPLLADHFVWDAQRLSKFDGEEFVRFYHEPWTAERFWTIQTSLPPNAKPLLLIFYADKTKLSSFGTEKGYPVVVRCANLPVHIRNGDGIGGGCVVGWLPVVKEDSSEDGKAPFVNHKREVWHEAVFKILENGIPLAKTGYTSTECADKIIRQLFLAILIKCADYEEQCIMALIRGIGSKFPCPICMVPIEYLSDLSRTYPLRTASDSQRVIAMARTKNYAEGEQMLKDHGLRNIDNVFWKMGPNSDPHEALSWDRLHAYHGGLFEDHIWSELKKCLGAIGRHALVAVDQGAATFPRFRNLNHFDSITNISFSDGGKLEDIAKIVLYISYSVINKRDCAPGYQLLRLLRSYINLDVLFSLEVQTDHTISRAEKELLRFSEILKDVQRASKSSNISNILRPHWNFPKIHSHIHAPSDIRQKGATRNYNTKPSEKAHGNLKDAYQRQTNFKNVAAQILRVNHNHLVAEYIRSQLDVFDEAQQSSGTSNTEDLVESNFDIDNAQVATHCFSPDSFTDHATLGAAQKQVLTIKIEEEHSNDAAFSGLRRKLSAFLNTFLSAIGKLSPDVPITPRTLDNPEPHLVEHRFMKVHFESMVDWRQSTDYLRCTPNFHGHSRYDCVIISTAATANSASAAGNTYIFGRLLFVFTWTYLGQAYPLALILPFDPCPSRSKDKDLEFTRVKERQRQESEIFSVHSIIRGAVAVQDPGRPSEYIIMDTLDGDMFLRLRPPM